MGNWYGTTSVANPAITESSKNDKLNDVLKRDERYKYHTNKANDFRGMGHADINARKISARPIKNQGNPFTNNIDPVHNIALQNAVAQPGGGKAIFIKHRTDIGDLYGGMSREDDQPRVTVVTVKPEANYNDFAVSYQSIADLQNHYFAGGAKVDTLGLVQLNSAHDQDSHKMLNR